jgi:hypothetical protein
MVVKADKGRMIVIISKEQYKQKTFNFINKNQFHKIEKDPTEHYHKQIQHALQKCNALISKQPMKYLNQPRPMAPTLNMRIKIQKENNPICAVMNNIQAPTYKLAEHLKKKIRELVKLQYTFVASNPTKVANDLTQIKMKNNHRLIITLDIKDLYVNIPIKDILFITEDRLSFSNTEINVKKQSVTLLREILNQNYFQFDKQCYKPHKGIAMASPISGLVS